MPAGIINLRRRIKSVNNTLKTTSAMQLISSVKMKRAVETATKSRSFVAEAQAVLGRILAQGGNHPLLHTREIKTVLLVVVTADRGLAGSYVSDVLKLTKAKIAEHTNQGRTVQLITVGRKGGNALKNVKNATVLAAFDHQGDSLAYLQSSPIGNMIIDEYRYRRVDQVEVIYQHYVSTITQAVRAEALIPVIPVSAEGEIDQAAKPSSGEYHFEPSQDEILDAILPYLVNMNFYQWILEAHASEHAARMMAMKNATDAGEELVQDLTFTANQIRQAKITAEIAEIAAGAAAIN